jgi:hypothetical protein
MKKMATRIHVMEEALCALLFAHIMSYSRYNLCFCRQEERKEIFFVLFRSM